MKRSLVPQSLEQLLITRVVGYRIILHVLVMLCLLFSSHASGQGLTDEERQERCKTTRNRVAELEKQSAITMAELRKIPSAKEIEDARGHMVFVRKLANNRQAHSWHDLNLSQSDLAKLTRIDHAYHGGCTSDFYQDMAYSDVRDCFGKLHVTIGKKIDKDKVLLSQKPTLLKRKAELEKQMAYHRNNLVSLGCDHASSTQPNNPSAYDPKSVAGTWTWSYAERGKTLEKHGSVTFVKTGHDNGTMKWSGGSHGIWTQSGQSVRLEWQDKDSIDTMTLSADGHNLSGSNKQGWVVEGTRGMK
jgi:hypothetical protein